MSEKNFAEVLIDGVVYTLGGMEDEGYLRRVAAYLTEKIGEVRTLKGFNRMNADYQTLLIQLNLADDYFKEQQRAEDLEQQKSVLEKEAYSLKHELITTQMRLETLERELQVAKARLAADAAVEAAADTAADGAGHSEIKGSTADRERNASGGKKGRR